MLSPECGVLARALNEVMSMTTSTGLALGLLGVSIGAAALAYSKFSQFQEEQKQQAAAVIAGLQAEADAFQKVAQAGEKAGMARRGAGAGTGEAMAGRVIRAAQGTGAGKAEIERATALALTSAGSLSEGQLRGLVLQEYLGKEPPAGSDASKRRRMLAGQDLGLLEAGAAAKRVTSPRGTRLGLAEAEGLEESLTPGAKMAERLAILDAYLTKHPASGMSAWTRTGEADLLDQIRADPSLGAERFEIDPGKWGQGTAGYRRGGQGRTGMEIVENHFHGGIQTIIQDRKMEAGSVPVNRGR
jgi:hypothetical protein